MTITTERHEPRPVTDCSVHAVINGALAMTPGKIAAQTFQLCQRLYRLAELDAALAARLEEWEAAGTKTVVHVAETAHVFERLCKETPGAVMIDEGVNEVEPGSATMFATWPCNRAETPRLIKHKRLRVWRDNTAA
jgi:peptidyl-tRNA hydrolase